MGDRLSASAVSAPAKAVDRHAGEDQRHRPGAAAGERVEQQRRDHRAGDAAERHREGEGAGEAGIEDDDRAQRRAAGDADDAGVGERIAQQPLQRRAGEAEAEADHRAERGARQADLLEHHRRHARPAGEDVGQGGGNVEPCVADHQRGKRGDERQPGERGDQRSVADFRARRARAHCVALSRARRRGGGREPLDRLGDFRAAARPQPRRQRHDCHPPRQRGDRRVVEGRVGERRRALFVAIEDQQVGAEQRHDLERNLLVGGDIEPLGEIVEAGAGKDFVDQRAGPDGEAVRPQHDRLQPQPARVDRDARQARLHVGDQRLATLRLAERGGEIADLAAHAVERLRRADFADRRADLFSSAIDAGSANGPTRTRSGS